MFCEFYEVCYDLIVSNHRVIFQLKHNSATPPSSLVLGVAALLGSLEVDLSIARGAGARRVRACLPPHLCCAHPADVSNCVGDLLGACFDKMSGYPVSDLRERCIPRHVFGGAAAVCARCLPLVASPVGFGGLGWRFGH